MNSLRKKIKLLEEDIEQRKRLTTQAYTEAKGKVQEAVISPAAFGIAFLSGMLLTFRRKKAAVKKTKTSALSSNFFAILSELSSIFMLTQYAQKFLKKEKSAR